MGLLRAVTRICCKFLVQPHGPLLGDAFLLHENNRMRVNYVTYNFLVPVKDLKAAGGISFK